MNKKETLAVTTELERLKTLLALKHHEPVKFDVPAPHPSDKDYVWGSLVCGYSINVRNGTVYKSCSTTIGNGHGWITTTSQRAIEQYSTPERAYRALLHHKAMQCAREMREIELKMESLKLSELV